MVKTQRNMLRIGGVLQTHFYSLAKLINVKLLLQM